MNLKCWYSRESDNWRTPSTLYNKMINLGYYDPCPINPVENGLQIEWQKRTLSIRLIQNLKNGLLRLLKNIRKIRKLFFLFQQERIHKLLNSYMIMEATLYLYLED